MADEAEPGRDGRTRSATTQVREWIRDRIDPSDRGATPRIAEGAVAWLQETPELLDRFLYEQVFNTTAEIVRAVMLETRRVKRFTEVADESEETKREALQRWLDRREHVNPQVGYVRLGAMTAEELLLAAQERETRAKRDLGHARWFRMLATGMDEGQTVEERYTALQVEEAYESATDAVNARMEGIMSGADEALRRILYPNGNQNNPSNQSGAPAGK